MLQVTLSIDLLLALLSLKLTLFVSRLPLQLEPVSSHLLFELLRLATCVSVTARRFGRKLAQTLTAQGILCLRQLVIPFISQLQLLALHSIGYRFQAQGPRQISPKWRCRRRSADYYRRAIKFPGDARRQISLAATPGRMHHRISERSKC